MSINTNLNLNYDFTESLRFQMLGSVNIASVIGESWATERTEYIAQIRGYDYGTRKPIDADYKNSQLPVGENIIKMKIRPYRGIGEIRFHTMSCLMGCIR